MDEKNDFQNLDKLVIASHGDGQPVLRIGFMMQLFLRYGYELSVRHRVVDVLADIAKTASPSFTHYQKDMANRMSPIKGKDLATLLHAEIDRIDPEVEFYGPHISDAERPPRWQAAALLLPKRSLPRDLSRLHLAIPATIVKESPDDLIRRLTNWCQQTQPLHGTAGLTPIYAIGAQESYPVETWPLLSRFTGLDYMSNFTMAVRGVNQIRTINWLTVLGTQMLDEIGGLDHLTELLTAASRDLDATEPEMAPSVHPYDGGVLIRAGLYPQVGDRNIGGIPKSYRVVNKALRPWLFTDYENYPTDLIPVPPPLDAYEETIRWVTRFDAEE